MSHDGNDNQDVNRLDVAGLNDAALIRAAADGELGARAELDRRAPDDAEARLAFESSLRDAIGRVLGASSAPASLRAKVIAMMHQAEFADAEPVSFVEAKAHHEAHIEARETHRRRMGVGMRRGMAIAAVAALGAGAVWMGWQNTQDTSGPAIGNNASLLSALSFVSREHDNRAVFDTTYRRTFTVNVDEAVGIAERELGRMPGCLAKAIRGCKDSGMVFAGLSSCSVPGGSGAVHVMYWSVPDESAVSLFIVSDAAGASEKDRPTSGLKGDTSYVCPKSLESGTPLQVWRRGGFTFYLASGHNPLPVVRQLHEAPAHEEMLGSL